MPINIFDDSPPPPPVAFNEKIRVPKPAAVAEDIEFEPVRKAASAPPPADEKLDDFDSLDSLIGGMGIDESELEDDELDGLELGDLPTGDGGEDDGGEDVGLNEVIDAEFVLSVYEIFREQGMKLAHDFDISKMQNIVKAVKKYRNDLAYKKTKTDEEVEIMRKLDTFLERMESSWEKVSKAIQWSSKHRALFVRYLKHQLKAMLGDTKMGVLAAFLLVEATAIGKVFMQRDMPDLDVQLPEK